MEVSQVIEALFGGDGLGPDAELDEYAERILEAAEQELFKHGLRRTSLDRVVKAAGVGRVTLFRRFANRDALLAAVVARSIRRFIAEFDAEIAGIEDPQERFVRGVVTGARLATEESLLSRLVETDPDELLPLMTTEGQGYLTLGRAYVTQQIIGLRDAGLPVVGDPELLAEIFVRVVHSMLLGRGTSYDEARVEEFARTNLLPLLTGGTRKPEANPRATTRKVR
jgi:TetR/AcrR family transcriptional repressor of uid operon